MPEKISPYEFSEQNKQARESRVNAVRIHAQAKAIEDKIKKSMDEEPKKKKFIDSIQGGKKWKKEKSVFNRFKVNIKGEDPERDEQMRKRQAEEAEQKRIQREREEWEEREREPSLVGSIINAFKK